MLYSSDDVTRRRLVSMKSGLRDRNNLIVFVGADVPSPPVSMKSGLRDRNNPHSYSVSRVLLTRLNEVRS